MKVCWILVICTFALAVCEEEDSTPASEEGQGDVQKRTSLFNRLTKGYVKGVNPDSPNLKFGMGLINIDIDENKSTLESNVWLKYVWKDSRLVWDAKEWGIDVLRVESSVFWKPDIVLYNGADLSRYDATCWDSNLLIYPSGKVLWVPPCHLSSFCSNNLKQHPFDPVNCFLKFGSWTYDDNILDIGLYHNQTSVDLSDFWNLSGWKVVDTSAAKNVKFYSCCSEPYSDITFNITLKRKPAADSLCSA